MKIKEFFNPDANAGGGYGRLGKSNGVGTNWVKNSEFPYRDHVEDEDCDCDECFLDQEEENLKNIFANNINQQYSIPDPLNQGKVKDRFSFVSAGTRLGERIETPDGRSGPNSPAISGMSSGWTRPPPGNHWDEEEKEVNSIEDIPSPDERAVLKADQIKNLIHKRQKGIKLKENKLLNNLCHIFGPEFFF